MKKKLKKYFLLFSAICISLMMISTTTAIPITNSNKIKEENNKDFINQIKKSLKNKNFEQSINKLKELSNGIFNKKELKENIDELIYPSGPLTAKEWFNALIFLILCIIFYVPGLILAIILEYVFWAFLIFAAISSKMAENGYIPQTPEEIATLLGFVAIIALVPAIICLPLLPFYPIIILWAILTPEEVYNLKDIFNFYNKSTKSI